MKLRSPFPPLSSPDSVCMKAMSRFLPPHAFRDSPVPSDMDSQSDRRGRRRRRRDVLCCGRYSTGAILKLFRARLIVWPIVGQTHSVAKWMLNSAGHPASLDRNSLRTSLDECRSLRHLVTLWPSFLVFTSSQEFASGLPPRRSRPRAVLCCVIACVQTQQALPACPSALWLSWPQDCRPPSWSWAGRGRASFLGRTVS